MKIRSSILLVFAAIFFTLVTQNLFAQTHFTPPDNNYQPMNIFVVGAKYNGVDLVAGDEIGVFDGALCVGTRVLTENDLPLSLQKPFAITTPKDDGSGNGFTEGHPILFKIWDVSAETELPLTTSEVQFLDPETADPIDPVPFTGQGTAAVLLNGGDVILSMAVSPAGGGTTDPAVGDHPHAINDVVNITATPATGYQFVNWTGDVADPNSASTTVTMDANKTITANFEPIQYTLTMAVNPGGGGTTDPPIGPHSKNYGEVVNITANPATGYQFVNWTGDVADPNSASTTVTMDGDKTVTANFEPIQYTLTMAVDPPDGGTTDPPVGPHLKNYGEVVNITANPATGYQFVNWTGDVADPNSASTTVTMDGDKTVTANFEPIQYTLTMAVNPEGSGTTDPPIGPHTKNYGEVVNITATPAQGYIFVNWTGDVADPNSASTTVTMDGDKTVTANFEIIQYTLTMAVDPPNGGTTTPTVGSHNQSYNEVVEISAIPAGGYEFVNWSGDVADPNSSTTTVTMNGDKTVTANFQTVEACVTYEFPAQGWYMISLPVVPADNQLSALFPTALGAFEWLADQSGYNPVTQLQTETGYWLVIPSATTVEICGVPVISYTRSFDTGWYMVGSVLGVTDFIDPNDNPDGAALTPAFSWQVPMGPYYPTTTFNETESYWVAIFNPCELTIGDYGGTLAKSNGDISGGWQAFAESHGMQPPAPPYVTDVEQSQLLVPQEFELDQNYPNPFNPQTTIAYALAKNAHTTIVIYNLVGSTIRTLVDQSQDAGRYKVVWDGRDDLGESVPSGVYFIRINAGNFAAIRKATFLK